jgi:hypothetical protein
MADEDSTGTTMVVKPVRLNDWQLQAQEMEAGTHEQHRSNANDFALVCPHVQHQSNLLSCVHKSSIAQMQEILLSCVHMCSIKANLRLPPEEAPVPCHLPVRLIVATRHEEVRYTQHAIFGQHRQSIVHRTVKWRDHWGKATLASVAAG